MMFRTLLSIVAFIVGTSSVRAEQLFCYENELKNAFVQAHLTTIHKRMKLPTSMASLDTQPNVAWYLASTILPELRTILIKHKLTKSPILSAEMDASEPIFTIRVDENRIICGGLMKYHLKEIGTFVSGVVFWVVFQENKFYFLEITKEELKKYVPTEDIKYIQSK